MYGISLPEDINRQLLDTVNSAVYEKIALKYEAGQVTNGELQFYGSKNLLELESLFENLRKFLGPIWDDLPKICFFRHCNSNFFVKSTKDRLRRSVQSLAQQDAKQVNENSYITALSEACAGTLSVINQAIEGNITLNQLGLDLSEETGKEISIFEASSNNNDDHEQRSSYGEKGFEALMSLTNIHEGVQLFESVCNKYELEMCIHDDVLQKLSMYSSRLRIPEDVQLKTAFHMKMEFHSGFPNLNGDFETFFELFRELRNSFMYVQFLRSKGFIGEAGKRKFSQERNLITQEIQNSIEQKILDDLWDAYSVLSYFLDTKISYQNLKSCLESLNNIERSVLQIKALQQHSIQQLDKVFALKEVRII